MAECSNPVQCQMAKRELCRCACRGANHSTLRRLFMDDSTREEAGEKLATLKAHQVERKKQRRKDRREARKLAHAGS